MNKKQIRKRLFIRRGIVCLCLGGALILAVHTTIMAVKGIMAAPVNPSQLSSAGRGTCVSSTSSQQPASSLAAVPPARASSASSAEDIPVTASAKPESWFDDAVFIGNSLTEGLRNYDGLGDADYYAVKGLMVSTVYTKQDIKVNGKKATVMQALQKKTYGKVYIMLGVNELGWSSPDKFVEDYGKMIDDIKKYQPGAKIYIQSILPVSQKKSDSNDIYTNTKINCFNKKIQKIAEGKKVKYLNVSEAVSNSAGVLPESASVDGVHLNAEYCKKWCEYLKTHT